MRHAIACAHPCTHLKHRKRTKKARLVWLKKLQGVLQIARLKQQRSLSFTFCKTKRSYEKIMCIYFLFHWFIGKSLLSEAATRGVLYKTVFLKFAKFTRKHLCQSLIFNKLAVVADVFTYRLNLKIFEYNL